MYQRYLEEEFPILKERLTDTTLLYTFYILDWPCFCVLNLNVGKELLHIDLQSAS